MDMNMKSSKIYRLLAAAMLLISQLASAQSDTHYVQLLRNGYYDTGYKVTKNTKVWIHFVPRADKSQGQELFGATGTNGIFGLRWADNKVFLGNGTKTQHEIEYSIEKDRDYYITYDLGNITIDKNPDAVMHDVEQTFDVNRNTDCETLFIGSMSTYSSLVKLCQSDIHEIIIWEAGKKVRHYFPSTSGDFYDNVTGQILSHQQITAATTVSSNVPADKCQHKFSFPVLKDGKYHMECPVCGNRNISVNDYKYTSDFTIITDPMFDPSADMPGYQMMMITAANKMSELLLMDSVSHKTLANKKFTTPAMSEQHVIKQGLLTEPTSLYVWVNTLSTTMRGTQMDSIRVWEKHTVKYMPMHDVDTLVLEKRYNPDKQGVMKPSTHLSFAIKGLKVVKDKDGKDVLAPVDQQDCNIDDYFIIERSFDKNFYEPMNIGSVELTNILKGELRKDEKDGTYQMWYTFKDDEDLTHYASEMSSKGDVVEDTYVLDHIKGLSIQQKELLHDFYTYPNIKAYYRVVRGGSSIWANVGTYEKRDSIVMNQLLPKTDSIRVEKEKDWESTKRVNVRIKLMNPYPWEYNPSIDANALRTAMSNSGIDASRRYVWNSNASIEVKRYSTEKDDKGKDWAAQTYTIPGNKVTWDDREGCYVAVLEDVQQLPYIHYYYNARVDAGETGMHVASTDSVATTEAEANACYSENSMIVSDLAVSKGERGAVTLEWNTGGLKFDTQKVLRREYQGADAQWETLSTDKEATFYVDNTARIGKVYEYRVEASMAIAYVEGNVVSNSVEGLGYVSYRGKIGGRIMMSDGTAMAGVKVQIRRDTPIIIPTVVGSDGNIIMQGVTEGLEAEARPFYAAEVPDTMNVDTHEFAFLRTAVTDSEGRWEFDNLLMTSEGADYTVSTLDYAGDFEYLGIVQAAEIRLSNTQYESTDVNFRYTSTMDITGYVYYRNSTVPVPGATFMLNGVEMKNSVGETITTQPDGKFRLLVSTMQRIDTLMVYKKGHKFANDGIIFSNTVVKNNPNGIIYDDSKVRLAGRLVGGNVQGSKPMAMGKSKNNLGDNLTLVLELEGDNSASFIYHPTNPNLDHETTTVDHIVQRHIPNDDMGEKVRTDSVGKTTMLTERKRITITPDQKTGEFVVDLFPAKYRIAQMYATGYNTLYGEGEGLQVIDLSKTVPADTIRDNVYKEHDITYHAAYDTIFNRTYHNPVNVTYQQYKGGRALWYMGEEKMDVDGITGMFTSYLAQKKDSTVYTFGYPIFLSGKRYSYKVSAHEDYYWNNTPGEILDIVPIPGDTLIVRNGVGSNDNVVSTRMDSKGEALIAIEAGNASFFEQGEDALRTTHFMIHKNGMYYEGKPLKGYVMGSRYLGTNSIPIGSTIRNLDVVRDPVGTNSYAYREKGTTYHWIYDKDVIKQNTFNFQFNLGVGWRVTLGWGISNGQDIDVGNINLVVTKLFNRSETHESAEYTMTTTNRIQTSADPFEQGAMADVYIGTQELWGADEMHTITVIPDTIYRNIQDAVEQGYIQELGRGRDANGNLNHIVATINYSMKLTGFSNYAYSQKYIVGTLIPSLRKQLESKLTTVTTPNDIEDFKKKDYAIYWRDPDNPDIIRWNEKADGKSQINVCDSLQASIEQWEAIISRNEQTKVSLINKKPDNIQSVAGSVVEHKEEASSYYAKNVWDLPNKHIVSLSGGASTKPNYQGALDGNANNAGEAAAAAKELDNNSSLSRPHRASELKGYGISVGFSLGGTFSTETVTFNRQYYKMESAGYGYVLSPTDNGYMDVAVYNEKAATEDELNYSAINSVNKDLKADAKLTDESKIHNFVFVTKSGAQRSPWIAPDSTLYYMPGTPLGAKMLRIDNPKIYIDKPVANNIGRDERAVFTLHLTNETEIAPEAASKLKPSYFHLRMVDGSNPYGARIYMDGQPISGGRSFAIKPGETVYKTIEVERGEREYDYNDLRLMFRDEINSLADYVNFSVHYLPESSPVRLSLPHDKWVMNTNAQTDPTTGLYYIPVEITDFSTTGYENFDHIELQYKKSTEGSDRWVNLCSYYLADDQYYKAATGRKELMTSANRISAQFFGANNIEEQEYDLRAVTFCRLGSGYVSRASEVISGIKDTRRPEIFGMPTPSNGVLSFEDVISFPFTERIAYNHLNATSNFTVRGYTNETNVTYKNPLHFDGSDSLIVVSEVERSLCNRNLTIDVVAKLEGYSGPVFSCGNSKSMLSLWLGRSDDGKDNRLILFMGKNSYMSEPLPFDLSADLTRVGAIIDNDNKKVRFLADKQIVSADDKLSLNIDDGSFPTGKVYLGCIPTQYYYDSEGKNNILNASFTGDIAELRLWNKCLTTADINRTYNKRLTGYDRNLIGYWPINEATGNEIKDMANGATLKARGTSWHNSNGFSLLADHREIELKSDQIGGVTNEDYTLRLWFRTDSLEADSVALMRAGSPLSDDYTFLGFNKGKLVLQSAGKEFELGDSCNYANANWHSYVMTVSQMRNRSAIYVDGDLKAQGKAEDITRLGNDFFALGDEYATSHFDELSIWNKMLPDYYIREIENTNLHGTESDLKVYMPFETDSLRQVGATLQMTQAFSVQNEVKREVTVSDVEHGTQKTGEYVKDGTFLVRDGKDYSKEHGYKVISDSLTIAPLKSTPELTNLDFSWSSNGTALQINLNDADRVLNKQTVYVTVRDVEDERGNTTRAPHMWTYFVDKNVLRWNQQKVNITVPYGETTEVKVGWKNHSGKRSNFEISNNASWLALSTYDTDPVAGTAIIGSAAAEEENELTLHIGDGLSPGKYAETLYLIDDEDLSDPLIVNLTVEAPDPGWTIDPTKKYEYNMVMKGVVITRNKDNEEIIDDNPNDKVGAFCGNDCVGVANITNSMNNSHVYLTIYGDSLMQKKNLPITLRLWDGKSGQISELDYYPSSVDTLGQLKFKANDFIGLPPSSPKRLKVSEFTHQVIDLKKGWNWISFNVEPKALSDDLSSLINTTTGFTNGDILKRVNFSIFRGTGKNWYGSLSEMDYAYTYQAYIQADSARLLIRGVEPPSNAVERKIKVAPNQWVDMPYHLKAVQPLKVALSDFAIGDKANVGDIIKGYDSFAVASEDGWEGPLQYLRPGEGYYLYHTGKYTTFTYPESANHSSYTNVKKQRGMKSRQWEGSMPIIAVMDEETGAQPGDVLQAWSGDQCVAESELLPVGKHGEKRFFLSVNANEGAEIRFVLLRDGEPQEASTRARFGAKNVLGKLDEPCVISLTEADQTGTIIEGDTYNIGGYKVEKLQHQDIYITNGKKHTYK